MSNCKLTFVCAKQWEELHGANDPAVRYCNECKTNVHAVTTAAEFDQHSAQGHCVALLFEDIACTVGIPDWPERTDVDFDPIFYRPISELQELPVLTLGALEKFERIGDLVGCTEVRVWRLLGRSDEALRLVKEELASRGLTLGMNLKGWN
ncbi:hypothetical protein ACSFA0_24020 [Variovorax sp. LT1P1]|uniref:hypothetical protein n=1 Tax=Variovorax sp. LT1P1 TaxID=3443730 RepID=UPI003F463045